MNEVCPQSVQFPIKLQPLFQPAPYKILHGGRGSSKSWSIARALLLLGVQSPLRILCVRELQTSMADSVHALLKDQIAQLGLSDKYEIQQKYIYGPTFKIDGQLQRTTFAFEGIRSNSTKIKSYEGIDICWAEEAEAITNTSWEILIPTIRKNNSEIWISFNPAQETDATYVRFIKNPPPGAVVIEMNWRDNPWFNDKMRQEMETLKARDYDAYLNVWEGKCRMLLEGAVYKNELRRVALEGRITKVPYRQDLPVDTFWDLGWADTQCIWFRQKVGFEWHYIDYYEARQQPLSHYVHLLKSKEYSYGTHWLPHDAKQHEKGSGKSFFHQLKAHFPAVRVVPKLGLEAGINAAREFFHLCWFDEANTSLGIAALRQYRYEITSIIDSRTGASMLSNTPVHDWASHTADGFRYSAVAIKNPRKPGQSLAGNDPVYSELFDEADWDKEVQRQSGRKYASVHSGLAIGTTVGWMRN